MYSKVSNIRVCYIHFSSRNSLLFQTNRPEAQYRLRCSLSGNQHKLASTARHAGSGVKEISPTSSTLASANKQLENLSKKVCMQNPSFQITPNLRSRLF